MNTIKKEYTKKIMDQWHRLIVQMNNGYHMSDLDKQELLRLNHLIMETCHDIHNSNMLSKN